MKVLEVLIEGQVVGFIVCLSLLLWQCSEFKVLSVCSLCLQILHFFNTPPGLDEETLKQVFMEGEVVEPKSIKLFPSKSECEDL